MKCDFCSELRANDGSTALAMVAELPAAQLVLARNQRAAAIPSIGALVPGHLLVCPLEHVPSLGALDAQTFDSVMRLSTDLEAALAREFGANSLVFEHGPGTKSAAGSCVDHAHLHIVPMTERD